jgi:membrane protease YdiL (CAAX protease family)
MIFSRRDRVTSGDRIRAAQLRDLVVPRRAACAQRPWPHAPCTSGRLACQGALGPVSAAFIVLGVTRARSGVGELIESIGRWRVGWGWWTLDVGAPVLMVGAAVAVMGLTNRRWPDFGSIFAAPSTAPAWLVDSLLIDVVYGLGEEPGWRGYALHKLQGGRNVLVATLLIFAMWAVLHEPFFLYRFPFGAGNLVGFQMGLFAGALWLSYLYTMGGGSTLLPMVWHALFNAAYAVALAAVPGGVAVISVLAIFLGIFRLVVGGPPAPQRSGGDHCTEGSEPLLAFDGSARWAPTRNGIDCTLRLNTTELDSRADGGRQPHDARGGRMR